jgi:hypothetical protein
VRRAAPNNILLARRQPQTRAAKTRTPPGKKGMRIARRTAPLGISTKRKALKRRGAKRTKTKRG